MSAEDLRIEAISADDESSEDRNSIFFSTIRSRHVEHFFPEPSTNQNNQRLKAPVGIVRYPEYDQCNPNRTGIYPNLILNRLSFSRDLRSSSDRALLRLPVLKQEFHNVTFELSSGDIMAVLYTRESEMMSLLKVISGSKEMSGKLSGDIFINGHRMTKDRLGKTIAFLSSEAPSSSLTVSQYLSINASVCPPMNKKYGGVAHLINKIMSDMGLAPVCDIICSRLNRSQWQRTKTAANLIKDPTILICADILRGCDIHDQAFLIDYLRDWAVKSSKIVIFAISPSSMELLNLFSKALIMASGRVVYFGHPGTMQQYFESIGCPCPPHKNICDYYVDLVTHDNLTSDASRESSIRIARLVNKWSLFAPPVNRNSNGKVLLDLSNGSIFRRFFATFALFWFDFTNNKFSRIITLLFIFLISTALSFYLTDMPLGLPEAFLDRQAFIDIATFYYPLLIGMIHLKRARHHLKEFEKLQVFKNCSFLLYYLVGLFSILPNTILTTLAFTIPISSFIDFHQKPADSFGPFHFQAFGSIFIITFSTILIAQITSQIFSSFDSDTAAFFGFAFLWSCSYLTSGFPVQLSNVPLIYRFLNPSTFNGFHFFTFLYEENPTLLTTFSPSFNFSKPLKLLSCGKTVINTTQATKGPCQRVSSAELLLYYDLNQLSSLKVTSLANIVVERSLLLFFAISLFLFFAIGVILLVFRFSRKRNR